MMSRVRTPEPEGFADFWAIWLPIARRNDGRGLARETYRKHMLAGVEPQDIIDGARWYARGVTSENKQFVPLSSTWLNRSAYEDDCIRERAYLEREANRQPTGNVVSMPLPLGRQREMTPENRERQEARRAHSKNIMQKYGAR